MLVVMLVLAILAAAFFFIDSLRSAWQNFVSIGLTFLASSVAVYAFYLLEAEGKV